MDIEYHYYITYLIAIACGFKMHEAHTIAYSSQMVDDNNSKISIYSKGTNEIIYQNLPSALSHKNIVMNDIEKILIPFHFLPDLKVINKKSDKNVTNLFTKKNSKIAKYILVRALKSKNLYRIGVATHAFVDSWAHQNFLGNFSGYNAFKNSLAKLLPNIGHLDALDKPDLVGLIWKDERLQDNPVDNVSRFLQATKELINIYLKFTKNTKINLKNFLSSLQLVMKNKGKNEYTQVKLTKFLRIKKYNEVSLYLSNFDILNYRKNLWLDESTIKIKNRYYVKPTVKLKNTNWFLFQEAIKSHYNLVLKILKLSKER